MYCILVTGMPAAGKSTMAKALAEKWNLSVISKDAIKEVLFDHVGFGSRAEKVQLGIASMEIMYHMAEQLMKAGQPFILENNFEYSSGHGLTDLSIRRYMICSEISDIIPLRMHALQFLKAQKTNLRMRNAELSIWL